jgi:hypothetical protein
MLISATSALVLNWTANEIWKSRNAWEYFESLDLSEGNTLLASLMSWNAICTRNL